MDEEKQVGIEKEAIRLGRLLLSCWWIILIVAVVSAGVAYLYTQKTAVEVYQSTTKLYVLVEDKNSTVYNGDAASRRVESYRIVLKSPTTLQEVIDTIKRTYPDYPRTYGSLAGMVSSSVDGETEIFTVTVTCGNKDEAYLIARAIVTVMQERIPYLFGSSAKVGVVDSPLISSTPVAPPSTRNALIGFLVGALACCAVIVVLDLLNDRLKSEDWLTQNYGGEIPVLASIPDTQHGNGSRGYRYSYKHYGYYYGYGSHTKRKK